MAIFGGRTSLSKRAKGSCVVAALLIAAACGEKSPNADPDEQADDAREVLAVTQNSEGDEKAVPVPLTRTPIAELDAEENEKENRSKKYHRSAWSSDDAGLCNVIASVLSEGRQQVGEPADHPDAQARFALGTRYNVKWANSDEDSDSATLDYFNDDVTRTVERRAGTLAGNRIITLWVNDGAGEFVRLDFGHAGANTNGLPAIDNLHTKLTYSVADIINIEKRYLTLIAPLKDTDASGAVFAISWRAKGDTTSPRSPRDYYPYINCMITPAMANE